MKHTRRSFLTKTAAASVALTLPSGVAALPETGGNAFGSYWRLVSGDTGDLSRVTTGIASIVEAVDAAMSPFQATSEITRLNRMDSLDWIELSPGMTTVLGAALDTSRQSAGAFDPTVGPVVGQYGFGPIQGHRTGDVGDLELVEGRLRRYRPGLTIDLCGIAKGWAMDLMAEHLEATGVRSYLLEVGGEVRARGQHPDGRPWRVALEGTKQVLEPGKLAVATSGLGAQSYRVGSRIFGHIIDPHRNAPATGDLISVTVLATTAMEADAWATALFSRGADAGLAMAETAGIDAVFLLRDGETQKLQVTGARARESLV